MYPYRNMFMAVVRVVVKGILFVRMQDSLSKTNKNRRGNVRDYLLYALHVKSHFYQGSAC